MAEAAARPPAAPMAAAAAVEEEQKTEAKAAGTEMGTKTEKEKENPFTSYYGQCVHQATMLQDSVRTGTYQQAMLANAAEDFAGKRVMDVGAGTGILSFFAAQAGAAQVFAVEASDMAQCCRQLAEANGMADTITVIHRRLEDIATLPGGEGQEGEQRVDTLVSEPIGFLLVQERMLESYIAARDKFLKPGGKMFPSNGQIIFAPCTDEATYQEQLSKASFWQNQDFYGVNLTSMIPKAMIEFFAQPVVGYFPSSILLSAERQTHNVDFETVTKEELVEFSVPFHFNINRTAIMHGLGAWFDIEFAGTRETVILSTSPDQPGTHWYQCRLLLSSPIAVNAGQSVTGTMLFKANDKFSYDITLRVALDGTNIASTNVIHLHDQNYQYLTNPVAATAGDPGAEGQY